MAQFLSFAYVYLVAPSPFIGKTIHILSNCLGIPVENQWLINVSVCFWILSSTPLLHVSTLMPVQHHLDYCCFEVSLKLESVSPPTLLFLFKIVLVIPDPLHFHDF